MRGDVQNSVQGLRGGLHRSTARPLGVRLKQQDNIKRAATTAVSDHLIDTGHTLDFFFLPDH